MRSPFPGMDPYLEDPGGWTGVHDGLIAVIRLDLNRRLGPDFVADAGASVSIVAPDERRWVFPGTPVEAPNTVSQPHILIRDRASREVVTIIEILSPINKAPASTRARADFLRKRADVLASATHWVEIDLLRAGERPPEVRGVGDYYVLVKRAGMATAGVWPIGIRDRLPVIDIPLRGAADVPLDLQSIFDQVYTGGRYVNLTDYNTPPPPPPFSLDDGQWVAEQVRQWAAARADGV